MPVTHPSPSPYRRVAAWVERFFAPGTTSCLLAAYVLLEIGLRIRHGGYNPFALLLVIASFGLIVVAFVWAIRGDRRDRRVPGTPLFALALVALLLAAVRLPALHYFGSKASVLAQFPLMFPFERLWNYWLAVLVLAVGAVHLILRRGDTWLGRALFAAAVIVAIGFRIWIPAASPNPPIDVFKMGQTESRALLDGKNPYTTPVDAKYRLHPGGPLLQFSGYTYLPGDLYIQVASYRLTGDVRYASVLGEILIALIVWLLARRRWSESTAELMALLFLYGPRSLLVISLAWVDVLILAVFAVFLLLRDREKPTAAAVVFGYLVFMKQYLVFTALQWLIIERNWRRILIAVGVGALTLLPFAIWDVRALVSNGVILNVALPFRVDSLTVSSLLHAVWGFVPPAGLSIVVGAVLTIATFIPQKRIEPMRGFLFAVTITTLGMFVFGNGGLLNWYYLVAGELLFLLVIGGKPGEPVEPVGASRPGALS